MKHFSLFLKLLSLDLITKVLAHIIAPTNSLFHLSYNKGMAFGLDLGFTMKFLVPLMILPVFLLMGMYLNKAQKSNYYQLVMAGFLGNYICRFTDIGVIDFINLQYSIANLADFYGWASYGLFVYYVSQNFNLKEIFMNKIKLNGVK